MKTKKVISLLVAAFMLLSMMAMPTFAADKDYTLGATGAELAKYGQTYELSIAMTTNAAVLGTGFRVTYNSTLFDFTGFTAVEAPAFTANATKIEDGVIECASSGDGKAYTGVWGKLTFTAKEGTEAADATFQCVADETNAVSFMDARSQQISNDAIDFGSALPVRVVPAHVAPTLDSVAVAEAAEGKVEVGTPLTLTLGTFTDNWGLAPVYSYDWKIGGTTVSTAATYTPAVADINKDITVSVTPAVDATKVDENATGTPVTATVKVVIDDAYAPTLSAEFAKKVYAIVPAELTVTYNATYEAVSRWAPTYQWYVVSAESADAAIAKVEGADASVVTLGTEATQSFAVEYKDSYAVVKVDAVQTIAGEAHATHAVDYAAALIKGEPPVLTPNIETAKKIRVGNTLSAVIAEEDADITVDNKYPEGAEITGEPEVTYLWEVVGPDSVIRTGNEATFKLTKEDVGYNVRVTINYANAMGIPADELVIAWDLAVEKKASGAPAAGTGANLSAPTTTPGTETPGTDKPGTETPGTETPGADVKEDPAGTANDKGAAVFTDVDKEAYAWAYEGIDVLTKSGVIKGMTESTFGPELTATNAQMIALAVRIAGLTAEGATTDKVDASHWVAAELAVADAKGILGVYGDKVDAEGEVTREIAFTLLYNALKAAGAELAETAEAIEFTDAASIDANCVEAINALVKAGIVNGMGDGTLAPKATLTRAQLAKILGMANAIVAK